MKHIFTISLCFLALSLSAQEDGLKVINGNVVFQHVFDGEINHAFLEGIRGTKNLREVSGSIFCDLVIQRSYAISQGNKIGFTYGNTPIWLRQSHIKGEVEIKIRQGRYQVTIRDIHYYCTAAAEDYTEDSVWDGCDNMVFKRNGQLKTKQWEKAKSLYDSIFLELFQLKEKDDSDW